MLKPFTILAGKGKKLTLLSIILSGMVLFTFASKGGGGDKKKSNTPVKMDFTPIRTLGGFTLKSGPAYTGSFLLGREKDNRGILSINTLVTYQKGNTIFVMPYRYKLDCSTSPKNNLQLLDVKISMHK